MELGKGVRVEAGGGGGGGGGRGVQGGDAGYTLHCEMF